MLGLQLGLLFEFFELIKDAWPAGLVTAPQPRASSRLAIEAQIEQREIAYTLVHLQVSANSRRDDGIAELTLTAMTRRSRCYEN